MWVCGGSGNDNGGSRLVAMDWRNGGPTLRTIPDRMYSKQETRNNVVFSEFCTLDFSLSRCGGINLYIIRSRSAIALRWHFLPTLSSYNNESHSLDHDRN